MSQTVEARLPRGMRDFLPNQMIRREYVIGIVARVFQEFGFEPLQTPTLERAETLLGKYGPDAEKLIFHAQHPGGKEELSLRYDLSVPLCRLVAQNRGQLLIPFKRYHVAPVWRAERPQRGRYREFYQCDCDIVGSSSLLADAEIMSVIHALLTRLGFDEFRIRFNSRKILNGLGRHAGVAAELLGGLYRSIDKLDKIGLEGVREELAANRIPKEVIERLVGLLQIKGSNRDVLASLRKRLADQPEALEGIQDLEEILGYLHAVGIGEKFLQVEFSMVRGLDYYDGSIYETSIEKPPMPSITGGGRYDRLIGLFLKESIPAVGTSFGIERIIDAMEELQMFPEGVGNTVVQVLVTLFSAELAGASLAAAVALRQAGLRSEVYFEPATLKSQFKYADRKGIPFVVVVGPEEAAAQRATVKNLLSGEQLLVESRDVVRTVEGWLEGVETARV